MRLTDYKKFIELYLIYTEACVLPVRNITEN